MVLTLNTKCTKIRSYLIKELNMDTKDVKQLKVDVPPDVIKMLKLYSVENDINMKDVVVAAIQTYIDSKKGK